MQLDFLTENADNSVTSSNGWSKSDSSDDFSDQTDSDSEMDFMFNGPNASMGLQALMGAKGAMGKIGPDTPNPFALAN